MKLCERCYSRSPDFFLEQKRAEPTSVSVKPGGIKALLRRAPPANRDDSLRRLHTFDRPAIGAAPPSPSPSASGAAASAQFASAPRRRRHANGALERPAEMIDIAKAANS